VKTARDVFSAMESRRVTVRDAHDAAERLAWDEAVVFAWACDCKRCREWSHRTPRPEPKEAM
jgi:hypothetical protein